MIDNNTYDSDIVISSRIRLARNLYKIPYTGNLYSDETKTVFKVVSQALLELRDFDFKLEKMKEINEMRKHLLKERHLISKELVVSDNYSAVAINSTRQVSIMINEEDHIRQQCIVKGLNLRKAFEIINTVDNHLISELDIDFDYKLGFLTSCPTNLGTGMRASVMLFLPAITIQGLINSIIKKGDQAGVTVRGVYGEGTAADGFMYQVSNQHSLGQSEEEIIKDIDEVVKEIVMIEMNQRKKLINNDVAMLKDIVNRAYGILTNCHRIASKEYMELIGHLKFGASIGIIEFKEELNFDELINAAKPATLVDIKGKKLNSSQRDLFRAEYISGCLKDMKKS